MGASSRLPLGLLLVVAVALLLLAPPFPAAALTPDGVLLLGFKYGVVSDPLAVLSSWKYDDENPCNWNGVSCAAIPGENGTSRVVGLGLPNARLLGSIGGDLGLIQHLRHLDLSGNSLSGSLPSSLFLRNSSSAAAATSSELRVLSLAGNEISGSIPEVPAGAMTDLQLLNLSDNALTGVLPAGVFSLPNLTVLSLSGNYLSGGLAGGGLPRAEFVDLSSNLINGTLPRDLVASDSSRLRYLNLSYNKLSGEIPASFAGELPSGAVVDLSFNNLAGKIPIQVLSSTRTRLPLKETWRCVVRR
ncbi:unnamed protein product [Spirodela intermedia]|uniref:Leucine-rich repeat-containing N-terminal plant-type domain-containing protein n=1 Tax=Spirodela intermedia TaxID=51605 RepID=A0A7I8JL69_SPIIN|nr:unnamed protein product [Spirodela intermedia]CAA6670535.1 unnamed protein product [Spirodela intermedia]